MQDQRNRPRPDPRDIRAFFKGERAMPVGMTIVDYAEHGPSLQFFDSRIHSVDDFFLIASGYDAVALAKRKG